MAKKKGVNEMLVQIHMVIPVMIYCFIFYPIVLIIAIIFTLLCPKG